jgi:hypothetical protein
MNSAPPGQPAAAPSSSTRTSVPTVTSTWGRRAAAHPVGTVAAAIATVTLLAAFAAALVPELGHATLPHPTLEGSVGEAFTIAETNCRTLIAPLLLCAGRWHTGRITRHVGDVVVAAIVAGNAALIGVALGRYPTRLPAYLPHLPLEDEALAIAAGAWLARRRPARPGSSVPSLARTATLTLLVTIAAAIVETYAVPHKA